MQRKDFPTTRAGAWSIALAAVVLGGLALSPVPLAPGPARADSHDGGGGHGGGRGPGGGQHDDDGHGGGHDDSGHSGGPGRGHGGGGGGGSGHAGTPPTAGHGDGGAGGQGSDRRGGRPVWAREGIPEVELGRLNVARSPDRVIDRAHAEALATFTPAMAAFYNLPFGQMIEKLSLEQDSLARIDSPLQNIALLKEALGGSSALRSAGVTTDVRTLQAVFLGTASDKTMPITPETATALGIILGYSMTTAQATALAASAERIRVAILAGHG